MNRNTRLLVILVVVAVGMLGLSYAFVPLYRVFCQAFGIPVPSVLVGAAAEMPAEVDISDRVVTVRFVANNAQGMPVLLRPEHSRAKVRLGEPFLTAYQAENTANRPVEGVAVHTLLALGGPGSVLIDDYIDLQQCFCFSEQVYPAQAEMQLPLSFTISPKLPEGIHTITFGYTLFEEAAAGRVTQKLDITKE